MKVLSLVVVTASLFAVFFVSLDARIIWGGNNCTCSKIDSLFMGNYQVNGERCDPDASCHNPTSDTYMIIYFAEGYRPPAGPQMGLALLNGRGSAYHFGRLNVTKAFDPICYEGKWYVQQFPYEIQYTSTKDYSQVFMDPTELNKLRLKHEIRSVMCGRW